MNLHPTFIISIAVMVLPACETTPRSPEPDAAPSSQSMPIAKSVPDAANDGVKVAEAIHNDDDAGENPGLGTIVYNGKPLVECGQQLRTGSRIRREVCVPDGYNGMYPSGGINMGTAKESQPRYD